MFVVVRAFVPMSLPCVSHRLPQYDLFGAYHSFLLARCLSWATGVPVAQTSRAVLFFLPLFCSTHPPTAAQLGFVPYTSFTRTGSTLLSTDHTGQANVKQTTRTFDGDTFDSKDGHVFAIEEGGAWPWAHVAPLLIDMIILVFQR